MGRSSFWFSHGYKGHDGKPNLSGRNSENHSKGQLPKNGKTSFLEMKIKSLLEKYKNDNETKRKILDEMQMYRLNLTIARNFYDEDTEKNLTKNFIQFLKQF